METTFDLMNAALAVAQRGLPVLPLAVGKIPFGNCPACRKSRCGDRPNMLRPGPCRCPRPCHAWAAATTDPHVIASPAWAAAWRRAEALAYHPGGAGLTVVDLDNADAVAWAREHLPATLTVATTRGEHWLYRGAMRSHNRVRPGVDIKSRMSYARWLGPGTGTPADLPDAVRTLAVKEETNTGRVGLVSSTRKRATWNRTVATGCRHTESYVNTGLAKGLALITARKEMGAGSQAFGVARFLASQHAACPGPCRLDLLAEDIIAAAVSVDVPEDYARRAVTNGLAA